MQKLLTSGLKNHLGLLLLLMVTFVIYAPSLGGDFIIDDIPQVRDNPYIHDFSSIPRYFTKGLWENSALELTSEKRYLPMTLVPMLLNYQLWGKNPFGYHLFLLLLHLANTCLVYVLIRKLVNGPAIAATVGAAIFALHPAKVGSVAWIIGGVEPLVTFFILVAMLAHLSYTDRLKENMKWRYLGLSLICFQFALWSKEVAIVFPLIVVAHDLIYSKRIDWPAALLQILVIVGFLIARSLVLGGGVMEPGIDVSQISRAIDFALGYSEMLLFALHIPFYVLSPEHRVSSSLGIVSAIVILAMAALCWKYCDKQRRKSFGFAIIWAVAFFWPAILLAFYTDGFYSPRYLYVTSVGVAIAVTVFYGHINETFPRFNTALMVGFALIVSCYGFLTWKEIPAWHDNEAIYTKVTQDAPEESLGFRGLGQFYFNHEEYAAAEMNYMLALQKSRTPDSRVDSLVALGTINGIKNNLVQSESYLQEAVKIDPKNSDAWSGLGNLAWVRGQSVQAIAYYEKALSIKPSNNEAAVNLASLYDKTGQSQLAEMVRKQASAYHR